MLNFIIIKNKKGFCMGNSSSGIIESPSLGTYSINLGLRQLGRTQSKSIFNINYEKKKYFNSWFCIQSKYK